MTEKQIIFKTTKEYFERRQNITVCICVCVKNRQERWVCVALLTPSVMFGCMHTLMHLMYLKLKSLLRKKGITAGRENESRSSRRKVFNFHESSVRWVICFSPSIFLFVPRGLSASTTPPVSVGVIDFVSLCFSPPGSSTLDMRVWVCVCRSKHPCFSSWITFIFSSSSSFVRLPVLSLTSLQTACSHLCHRPSCLLFCTLTRLLPVPSPSSTSLHYCCICKSFERCKCNYVLRWQRCLQICVCVCVYCVSLCVAKCIIATYYVPVCLLETPTN